MTRRTSVPLLLALSLVLTPLLASAQTFPAGSGSLSGKGKLRIEGCGKVKAPSSASPYALDASGTWTESAAGFPDVVAMAVPAGTSGRQFTLTYDPQTLFAVLAPLIIQASTALCETAFTLSSVDSISASLKFNKRRDRAVLRSALTYSGTTGRGSHRGRLKAKESGAWIAAP